MINANCQWTFRAMIIRFIVADNPPITTPSSKPMPAENRSMFLQVNESLVRVSKLNIRLLEQFGSELARWIHIIICNALEKKQIFCIHQHVHTYQ